MTTHSISADGFVQSITDFDSFEASLQCDLLAFYLLNHAGVNEVTGVSISSLRSALHLAPYNRISAYLSENSVKSRNKPRPKFVKLRVGYTLERSFAASLASEYLGRPGAKQVASGLRSILAATSDPAIAAYLEEAVTCFEYKQYRSSLIMSWCVAYGLIRAWIYRNHLASLNAEMSKWKSPKSIQSLDDFQEHTEGAIIETARKAGIISKEQFKLLKRLLDDRNSFAHPTTRNMTPATAEAYIEAVLKDVIPSFG
jgi:hypothetical protein